MSDVTTDNLRLSDVMGIQEARTILGLTRRQMRERLEKGKIERVKIATGLYAVIVSSVEEYAKTHEHGQ